MYTLWWMCQRTRPDRFIFTIPSFRDFPLDENRREDLNSRVEKKQSHRILAHSCVQLMQNSLKQELCNLDVLDMLAAVIESGRVNWSGPLDVQYACLY